MSGVVHNAGGYRGYITARPVRGQIIPQRVQNLVVRDYAERSGLFFKLSEVEYAMPGCYIILNSVMDELSELDGLIAYSLFTLPRRAERRRKIYDRLLGAGATLHCAIENLALSNEADLQRAEDILVVDQLAAKTVPQF